jgi:hypothetical protein
MNQVKSGTAVNQAASCQRQRAPTTCKSTQGKCGLSPTWVMRRACSERDDQTHWGVVLSVLAACRNDDPSYGPFVWSILAEIIWIWRSLRMQVFSRLRRTLTRNHYFIVTEDCESPVKLSNRKYSTIPAERTTQNVTGAMTTMTTLTPGDLLTAANVHTAAPAGLIGHTHSIFFVKFHWINVIVQAVFPCVSPSNMCDGIRV